MKGVGFFVLLMSIIVFSASGVQANICVYYRIDTEVNRMPISPYIYGTNFDWIQNATIRRSGGNRLTGYNWENNYSNAGNDWYHVNDDYLVWSLGVPSEEWLNPGRFLTYFHDESLAAGVTSIITLQMAGYVSADDGGEVYPSEVAPSYRWKQVVYAKGAPFCVPPGNPNTTDNYVYMDECVNFLVKTYGYANEPNGVKGYILDNEPDIWFNTHPRIHPAQATCAELIDKSVALSKAVKNVDPNALIFGPASYGFYGYYAFQGASDWWGIQWQYGYNWFLDYYLDQMHQAEINAGRRLLDVLDLHWYPEAQGDGQRIAFGSPPYSRANAYARMQAPRTLWDPGYIEDSWIAQWDSSYLPLLPTLFNSINYYYPGTKLAISEYNYGAEDHISGGIATADVLGIFGKYGVYMAGFWQVWPTYPYVEAAFKIYRNYDGAHSTFGDTSVYSETSDKVNSSIYASVLDGNDSRLHLIVINKNFDCTISGTFDISSHRNFVQGRVWRFNNFTSDINEVPPSRSCVSDNLFVFNIPPLTVCHIVLQSPNPPEDLDGDGKVTITDIGILCDQWLEQVDCPGQAGCADFDGSHYVDFFDFARLASELSYW
jgi:endoglucanase